MTAAVEGGAIDRRRPNRKDHTVTLRRLGFHWKKLDYEEAEEELKKWFLVGPDGETWTLERAFTFIADKEARTIPAKTQSVDLSSF
jgi:hypothetical protein